MTQLNVDISKTDFQALDENNMTLAPEEFRMMWSPPLPKHFLYECLHNGTLKSFKSGNRFKVPYSELRDFKTRLLLGNRRN